MTPTEPKPVVDGGECPPDSIETPYGECLPLEEPPPEVLTDADAPQG